jgi:N-acetyl-gamma-glutamyl-phosphate reductase
VTTKGLLELYRDYYAGNPRLHVQDTPPETKAVSGSDRALISVAVDRRSGMILAFSALDNLGKGAAGQAVQAFNIAFGLPETQALELEGRWP